LEAPELLIEANSRAGSGDAPAGAILGLNAAHVHDGVGIGDVGVGSADALVSARFVGTVDGIQALVLPVLVVGDAEDLTFFADIRTTVTAPVLNSEVVALREEGKIFAGGRAADTIIAGTDFEG